MPFFVLSYRVNAYLLAIALVFELYLSVDESEQRIVAAASHVFTGTNPCSTLTDEDIAGKNELTVRTLYAETLCI